MHYGCHSFIHSSFLLCSGSRFEIKPQNICQSSTGKKIWQPWCVFVCVCVPFGSWYFYPLYWLYSLIRYFQTCDLCMWTPVIFDCVCVCVSVCGFKLLLLLILAIATNYPFKILLFLITRMNRILKWQNNKTHTMTRSFSFS